MKSIPITRTHRLLLAAAAGAMALGLAGCDQKPATSAATNPGKILDGTAENQAPQGEPPATQAANPPAGDTALAARVKSALAAEPALKQSLSVDVNAADGVVTLFGTAENAEKSHQAAIVALNVDGVRSVKNELVVLAGS